MSPKSKGKAGRRTRPAPARAAGRLLAAPIDRSHALAAPWVGPVAIALGGVAMLAWSWRTWPDVLVDFGRELYTAWQLSSGAVLYTDIAYLNGPLSPYWNALLFRLFGTSFMTLAMANIVIVAVLVVLLYQLLSRASQPLAATAACLAFVALFAFGQLVGYGNYNFVAPYSHDLTHGVLLSVAAIFCVTRCPTGRRMGWVALAGIATGLLFLTKVEVFVAGGVATITGLGLTLWVDRSGRRQSLRVVAAFAMAAAAPAIVTFGLFSLVMPAHRALAEPLGHWHAALRSDLLTLPFYRHGMGVDDVGANLRALLAMTFWYAVVLGPAALLGLLLRKPGRYRPAMAWVMFALVAAGLGLQWRSDAWMDIARPLPLFMLSLGVVTVVTLVRRRRDPAAARSLILRACLIVFALVLLLKMVCNARLYHYGFVLAMPATLVLVVALLDWVPAAIEQRGGYGPVFAAAGLAALLAAVVAHLVVVDGHFRRKTQVVGSGGDAFLADARGAFVNKALEQLRVHAAPGRTLAVLPEGAMLNYLTRRVDPSPYIVLMPLEMALYGERRIAAAFQARPADYVLLVHKDTTEYGARFFGREYGREISGWIAAHYRPIVVIGARPLQDDRFGMLLLQRDGLTP